MTPFLQQSRELFDSDLREVTPCYRESHLHCEDFDHERTFVANGARLSSLHDDRIRIRIRICVLAAAESRRKRFPSDSASSRGRSFEHGAVVRAVRLRDCFRR